MNPNDRDMLAMLLLDQASERHSAPPPDPRIHGQWQSYTPPWYERLTDAVTGAIYGPDANARQTGAVARFAGPDNPFNLPAQVTHGIDRAAQGFRRGD